MASNINYAGNDILAIRRSIIISRIIGIAIIAIIGIIIGIARTTDIAN